MKLHQPNAAIFIPDRKPLDAALSRTTHLGIGAHHDDLEFMAAHGIFACHQRDDHWFGGVTCTNGAGSSRTGAYAKYSDEDMQRVRRKEQDLAARIGDYGAMIQLDYSSAQVKNRADTALRDDLLVILQATKPEVVYTHNLADKHDTHIGVAAATIKALRLLPAPDRPGAVYGCEVWRDLDWLNDADKVLHSVAGHDNLAASLNGVFDSQIAGGKRYDLGVIGRRRANATFFESHAADQSDALSFAMDLTPLVNDPSLDITAYITAHIDRFRTDVVQRLAKFL